jgi:hypothetical protein
MVLPSPGGGTGAYGYWLQPNVDGSISRLLSGGILVELKMDSILLLFIFKWLIHVANLAEA